MIDATHILLIAAAQVQSTASSDLIRTGLRGSSANTGSGADTMRVLFALIVVLGAILLCRWAMKRFLHLPGAAGSDLVKLLSRTTISPRQHILVIQVARRVLVLSDSGQQLATLCEITDPDEIRQFTGSSVGRDERNFEKVLRREMSQLEDDLDAQELAEPAANEVVADTPGEVRTLLRKVKSLSEQFR